MEPATITAVVLYLANKIRNQQSFKELTADLGEATINWFRSILLEPNGQPKEVLKQLQEKPDSEARRKSAEAAISVALEDNPEGEKHLKEIYDFIGSKQGQQHSVVNSKNVNTGTISAGGSVSIGDKNAANPK